MDNNNIVKLCEDVCKSEINFSYGELNRILEKCDSTNRLLKRLDEENEAAENEELCASVEKYDEYGNEVNEYGEALDSEKAIEREQDRINNLENDYCASLPSEEEILLSDISKNKSFYENINKSFPESKEFINNISKYGIKEDELGYLVGKIKGFESALNLLSNFKDNEPSEELDLDIIFGARTDESPTKYSDKNIDCKENKFDEIIAEEHFEKKNNKDTINIGDKEASNGEILKTTEDVVPIEQSYKQIYDTYINSDAWMEKKIEIANTYKLNNWNTECIRCGSRHNLQVHHNYYINNKYFGHENISDTDYLCAKCHKEWHKIQKSSGLSQNRLSEEYYNFVIADKAKIDQINYLLTEKIKLDTLEVEGYFLRADVIKYNKMSDKLNWIFLIAIILLFAYGIGIIIMIIASLIENKEPENFDLYKQKRNSLESKKCYLELLKCYSYNQRKNTECE